MSRRLIPALAVVCVCGAAIAGCGSSGPAAKPPAGRTAARTGEASKSPDQILADAAAALRKAGSFQMRATLKKLTPQKARMRESIEVFSAHRYLMSATSDGVSVQLIVTASKAYMKANQKFWSNEIHNPSAASLAAGRWFVAPARSIASAASIAGKLSPSRLAGCLLSHHGRLSFGGEMTVDDRPAILLDDAGNRPGGRRRTLAVAATGVPYPLQVTTTSKQRPGGNKGPCSTQKSSANAIGTVTFSRFDDMGRLLLPAHSTNIKSFNPEELAPRAPNT